MAPEIIIRIGYDFAADWWSLGVVLYGMLYGKTPFRGSNSKETFSRIVKKKDPAMRISVNEIKGHDFFRGVEWEGVVDVSRPPYIPLLEIEMGEEDEIDVEEYVEMIFNGVDESESSRNETERDVNEDDFKDVFDTEDGMLEAARSEMALVGFLVK
ncbi:hypothetical protein QQ045_001808 [Rhodiola kirilowii]